MADIEIPNSDGPYDAARIEQKLRENYHTAAADFVVEEILR